MERERWGAHAAHQRGRLVFRNRNLGTRGNFYVLEVVVKVVVELPRARNEQKNGWSAAVRADNLKEGRRAFPLRRAEAPSRQRRERECCLADQRACS